MLPNLPVGEEDGAVGQELVLHQHQRDAIEIANQDGSYVITSGTGSGKSRDTSSRS